MSDDLIAEVNGADFETINEEYHVVVSSKPQHYKFKDRRKVADPAEKECIRKEYQQEAYKINQKLISLGVNVRRVAQLNNPEAQIPNTMAAHLNRMKKVKNSRNRQKICRKRFFEGEVLGRKTSDSHHPEQFTILTRHPDRLSILARHPEQLYKGLENGQN